MSRTLRVVIVCLFVLSGITSLVYETLWIRVLSLGIGSTSTSMSMVLSVFFFGLSVGSYLSGKIIHRLKNPLRVYGYIEGAIGLYGLGLIYVLLNFTDFLQILPLSSSVSFIAFLSKFLIVFVLLLPPTVGMGATLPILVRVLSVENHGVGRNVAFLYTINTLGAVLGAFSTGYFFIPSFGVLVSNHIMVVLNLLIFAACFAISKDLRSSSRSGDAGEKASDQSTEKKPLGDHISTLAAPTSMQAKVILWVCGLVGFTSIGSQVIWSKYLGVFFGTNIFGLSLILATFLTGVAFGSYLLSIFVDRVQHKKELFFWLIAGSVLTITLSSQLLSISPVFANMLSVQFSTLNFLVIKSLLAAAILFVPTCLFGALLPLAINLLTSSNERAAEFTGQAYAVNTWGGILGSALVGLWFVPEFGSGSTLRALCLILLATLLLYGFVGGVGRKTTALGVLASLFFAGLVFFVPPMSFKYIIKSAEYSTIDPEMSLEDALSYFSESFENIVFIHEGKTAVTSLNYFMIEDQPVKTQFRLRTNGLNESFYNLDNIRQLPKYEGLLGMLPYALHRDPKSAFVVGYGGGFTVDLLTSLQLDLVHVAELEEGILKAADHVYQGNNEILERENLKLQIEDARFILNAGLSGPYDIIVSQPSHSWLSGVANLFTQEFFMTVRKNLTEKGIYAQWLNLYNMDTVSLRSIMHTFYSVFPHGAVFTDQADSELIFIGSVSPLELDREKLQQITSDADLQQRLIELPFSSPGDFLSTFSMSRETAVKISDGMPLNTDVNAFAEVRQSSMFYRPESNEELVQPYLSENFDGQLDSLFREEEGGGEQTVLEAMESMSLSGKFDKYFRLLSRLENSDGAVEDLQKMGDLCFNVERYSCALDFYQRDFAKRPTTYGLRLVVATLIASREFEQAVRWIEDHPEFSAANVECDALEAKVRGGLTLSASEKARLQSSSQEIEGLCGDYVIRTIGQSYLRDGDFANAVTYFERYYQMFPEDLLNLSLLSSVYLAQEKYESGVSFSQYLASVRTGEIQRLQDLQKFFEQFDWKTDAATLQRIQDSVER